MKNSFPSFYVIFLTFIYLILQIMLINVVSINTVVFINTIIVAMMAGKIWSLHEKCKAKDNIILALGYKIINLYKKIKSTNKTGAKS